MTGQNDYAIFDFNVNLFSQYRWFPFQFGYYVQLQLGIGFHINFPVSMLTSDFDPVPVAAPFVRQHVDEWIV
jgi:hypothetical protein